MAVQTDPMDSTNKAVVLVYGISSVQRSKFDTYRDFEVVQDNLDVQFHDFAGVATPRARDRTQTTGRPRRLSV